MSNRGWLKPFGESLLRLKRLQEVRQGDRRLRESLPAEALDDGPDARSRPSDRL